MLPLVLMYIYFDVHGDIKAITPSTDSGLDTQYTYTTTPLASVDQFLRGKTSTFDYYIKTTKTGSGVSHVLTKKQVDVPITRSLDSYITEIGDKADDDAIISITAFPGKDMVTIKLNGAYKALYELGNSEEKELVKEFINSGPAYIYITKKSDPYYLYHSLEFLPKDLYNADKIEFKLPNSNLTNTSAYTKRLVGGYVYIITERS